MDRFLVRLFPLLRRFAGFLVRSFFRASFPYFFRLKKGLVPPVGTKQPCFQKLEEIGAEEKEEKKENSPPIYRRRRRMGNRHLELFVNN